MQVLKLKKLFNLEGLVSLSEAEVNEVLEDTRIECSRFGTVKSVNYVIHSTNSNTLRASDLIDSGSSAERPSVEESDSDPNKFAEAHKSEPQSCNEDLVVDIKISEFGNSNAETSNPDISSNHSSEPEGSADYAYCQPIDR